MRTLPSRTLGDWVGFPDTEDPGCLWVIRARPVALGDVSLVRWHQPNGPADGRLLVEVGVGPSPDDLAEIARETGLPRIRALPIASARVRVSAGVEVAADATAVDDRVAVALDLPAQLAERVEAVATGTGAWPVRVTWEMTAWVQLPGGEVEVAADASLVGPLLDAGEAPPGVGGALRIAWAGAGLSPDVLLDWAWAELRARRIAGLPLTFRAAAAGLVAMPIALSSSLEALGAPRVQHVDLAAEDGLLRRRFDVRVAGDIARAGWKSVDVRLTVDGAPRFASPPTAWDLPVDRPATWAWRAVSDEPGQWSGEQPAVGTGWIAAPAPRALEGVVTAAALDLVRRWERVEVTFSGEKTVRLDRATPTARWSLTTTGPVSARGVFVAVGGAVREATWEAVGEVLTLADPEGVREVTVVPSGAGWTSEVVAFVDVEQGDERRTARLDAAGARFLLAGEGAWRWRAHIRHADGRYERGEWREETGAVAVLPLPSPAGTRLQLLPVWFDASWRLLRLAVEPTGGTRVEREVASAAPVDLVLDGALPAAWSATWVRPDGSEVTRTGTATVPVLVLPKA